MWGVWWNYLYLCHSQRLFTFLFTFFYFHISSKKLCMMWGVWWNYLYLCHSQRLPQSINLLWLTATFCDTLFRDHPHKMAFRILMFHICAFSSPVNFLIIKYWTGILTTTTLAKLPFVFWCFICTFSCFCCYKSQLLHKLLGLAYFDVPYMRIFFFCYALQLCSITEKPVPT